MAGALEGIKVIELSMFQQGPVAGMRLGDLGADVIKVEPKTGDPARGMMRIIGAETGLKGRNYYFENCNRNKRSAVIDLGTARGKEVFFKLIESADVFLNNLSIEAPVKLGIGPDDVMKRNARIIYAQASGWGRQGKDAHLYAFDYTGIARAGLMMSCGEFGDPPARILPGIADELGGLMLAWAITIALYAREKTGKGQLVDTSLMGSLIAMLSLVLAAPSMLGQEFPRQVRSRAGNPLYNHYNCKDDKWIVLAHLQPDRYWPNVCRALEITDLEKDPRFDGIEARGKNAEALIRVMDEKFKQKSRGEWMEIFEKEDCIFTPVQSPGEVVKDPQAFANNYFVDIDHPVWGKVRVNGFPWSFSDTPASWRREAPECGQHTEEIMLEAGYTWDDILKLKEDGAIG